MAPDTGLDSGKVAEGTLLNSKVLENLNVMGASVCNGRFTSLTEHILTASPRQTRSKGGDVMVRGTACHGLATGMTVAQTR